MYLIVGLGNPGTKYAGSRHNLGFQVVEALARRLNVGRPIQKHRALIADCKYNDQRIILAQPLTYMNLSGKAVKEIVVNYHLALSDILVIYDDLDLPVGTIRLRSRGGSGGHRGIQSIIDALETNEFPRLRIGIGRAPEGLEAADYVLMPVDEPDRTKLKEAVERAGDAALHFLEHGLEAAMNNYNKNDSD